MLIQFTKMSPKPQARVPRIARRCAAVLTTLCSKNTPGRNSRRVKSSDCASQPGSKWPSWRSLSVRRRYSAMTANKTTSAPPRLKRPMSSPGIASFRKNDEIPTSRATQRIANSILTPSNHLKSTPFSSSVESDTLHLRASRGITNFHTPVGTVYKILVTCVIGESIS